ncbi:hypothetical protein PCH_Pc20g14900 [Penicillium rubens Wisconsin 54-1255]|uniref:Uncharacterized protein n=1 Tax=Penicillium rubens (strain ATCC 28089 / DSM 1075 / NRRL 1951 / Wisconsin 54-1255) TaxID=500485 RepID=B6HDU7_PENRW|nr:hypothetical protein PCH_Pc20g14900 [Penicillium rubens Wisconsin 54-1255]
MDVLGPEGFILDFPHSQAIIESYENLSFSIALYAKPHHVSKRPVYASSKSALTKDRDYIFEPGAARDNPILLDDDSEEQAELDMGAKELEMGIDTYDPDRGITPSDIPGVILTKFSFPNSSD